MKNHHKLRRFSRSSNDLFKALRGTELGSGSCCILQHQQCCSSDKSPTNSRNCSPAQFSSHSRGNSPFHQHTNMKNPKRHTSSPPQNSEVNTPPKVIKPKTKEEKESLREVKQFLKQCSFNLSLPDSSSRTESPAVPRFVQSHEKFDLPDLECVQEEEHNENRVHPFKHAHGHKRKRRTSKSHHQKKPGALCTESPAKDKQRGRTFDAITISLDHSPVGTVLACDETPLETIVAHHMTPTSSPALHVEVNFEHPQDPSFLENHRRSSAIPPHVLMRRHSASAAMAGSEYESSPLRNHAEKF
uniref:Uncharacterized protein n=1 Tax=Percolomonas cosmopolitus TaxID=63605 RepID=A0A7S1KSA7_9EUKA|mmetsp:Transcript_6307/g.23758  ORF Transcript_6307/g.23758 Transcript_6307/m.23758 type:complete len:301 (+) Transcript_6307:221-1123(+)